ncbi:LysR family transcriptional regulator, partial [Rhodococcus chondri]
MELSLRRLRMLRELHRRGTVTAAALALHYTTSAVSQQLTQLERDVGTKLFERRGRRVELTESGLLLAEHAEEILRSVERATTALEQTQNRVTARLTIGVWASVAASLVPSALTLLAAEHPGIEVRTKELAPEDTADAVRDGSLDFSFVIDYSGYPMQWDPELTRVVIAVERLHAALPPGTVSAKTMALADLAEHPWVLAGPRSHFGRAVRLACQRCGFEPRINHEVGEQATALAMVAAGLGVTLVSDLGLTLSPPGVD